jgi:uncharacterized protein YndB with AHSA1/START domain/dihydrofolate reductase
MAHVGERIQFERVYDGPIEDLWALWTTKDGFAEWFAPEGCRLEVPVLELRVGGAFDHVMTAVGDDQVATLASLGRPPSVRARGRFVEIVHHERLHIRFSIDFIPGIPPYPWDLEVELHAESGRVRMVVVADAHRDAETTRLATETLARQLDQLESVLSSKRTRSSGAMRPLRYSINVTMDGCCDHLSVPEALAPSLLPVLHRHGRESLARADALLFGRVIYEMMEAAWRPPASAGRPEWMQPFAKTIDAAKKYVVSSTLERVDWNAELVRGDLEKAVQDLKRQPGKGLLVSGVKLPLALAELGLIDEYEFLVMPVLAGRGPTLLSGLSAVAALKLVSTRELGAGIVEMRYVRG